MTKALEITRQSRTMSEGFEAANCTNPHFRSGSKSTNRYNVVAQEAPATAPSEIAHESAWAKRTFDVIDGLPAAGSNARQTSAA